MAPQAPLEGITQGGYRLVFTAEPTKWIKSGEKESKNNELTYSGGFAIGNDGKVTSVLWDSAAFNCRDYGRRANRCRKWADVYCGFAEELD